MNRTKTLTTKNTIALLLTVGFFVLSQHPVFARCAEIRTQTGMRFCDYNYNGSVDPSESPFADCGGGECCAIASQCGTTTTSDCEPGLGFIPLGDCLQLSDGSQINETYTTPAFLVNLLVRNLFVAAGVVFFFMILIAGFLFISGGKKGFETAKQIATAAVVGFLLMFAAYWIVQIVAVVTRTDIPI